MPARKIFLVSFLLLFYAGCSQKQPKNKNEQAVSCACVGISDGDTITVITDNKKEYKIRLAHIDCPEKGQPFGNNAKKFTSDFCFGKRITVQHQGKRDRNGRVIGIVFNEAGQELNRALVEAGLAWHYKKYSDDDSYDALERQAREAKRGLWADEDPMPPWEWRKRR
jgi:endonuclease YncB( thermonuclease family)